MDFDGFDFPSSVSGPSLILPGLYLGSIVAARDSSLEEKGITHVVSVISDNSIKFPSHVRIVH